MCVAWPCSGSGGGSGDNGGSGGGPGWCSKVKLLVVLGGHAGGASASDRPHWRLREARPDWRYWEVGLVMVVVTTLLT